MGQVSLGQIPFAGSEDKSSTPLGGAAPTVVNLIPDATGTMRRRPGISPWSTFAASYSSGSPVIGMMAFGEWLVYVTADTKIHALSSTGMLRELSDGTAATKLDVGNRPSMIAGRNMLVMAGGGAIQKWTGTGLTARLLNTGDPVGQAAGVPQADFGAPPPSAFLAAIARRLVAQSVGTDGLFYWTGPGEQWENWDMAVGGAAYKQAAAKPDPIVAMWDNTNEVFCFGTRTIQVFAPSDATIAVAGEDVAMDFSLSRTQNLGTVSPYSVTPWDDVFQMLDWQKRFVTTDGRTYQDISKPIAQVLRDMKRIDDCWGFRLRWGRFDAMVWMFPTDGFGLVWDAASNNWSEWREGNVGTDVLTITSVYNWPEQDVFLVGMSDGSIAKFDDTIGTDRSGGLWTGTKNISTRVESGFVNHGNMAQKACRTAMFTFRRFSSADTGSGHVRISYRDNEGAWRILKDIELSASREPVVTLRSIGVYRTRQWRVEYTGTDELQLVSAQEEYETLGA